MYIAKNVENESMHWAPFLRFGDRHPYLSMTLEQLVVETFGTLPFRTLGSAMTGLNIQLTHWKEVSISVYIGERA